MEITGVFGRESVEVNLGRGAPVSTNHPTLGIILADLAVRPAKGDTAEISGTTYRVIDCQEDGEGGASLRLQKNV